jgi:hypothetical protein
MQNQKIIYDIIFNETYNDKVLFDIELSKVTDDKLIIGMLCDLYSKDGYNANKELIVVLINF